MVKAIILYKPLASAWASSNDGHAYIQSTKWIVSIKQNDKLSFNNYNPQHLIRFLVFFSSWIFPHFLRNKTFATGFHVHWNANWYLNHFIHISSNVMNEMKYLMLTFFSRFFRFLNVRVCCVAFFSENADLALFRLKPRCFSF